MIYSNIVFLNCSIKLILLWPDSWRFKCKADQPPISISCSFLGERKPWHRHALWFYALWVLHARSRKLRPWVTSNINSNVSHLNSWLLPRPSARNAVRDSDFKGRNLKYMPSLSYCYNTREKRPDLSEFLVWLIAVMWFSFLRQLSV